MFGIWLVMLLGYIPSGPCTTFPVAFATTQLVLGEMFVGASLIVIGWLNVGIVVSAYIATAEDAVSLTGVGVVASGGET